MKLANYPKNDCCGTMHNDLCCFFSSKNCKSCIWFFFSQFKGTSSAVGWEANEEEPPSFSEKGFKSLNWSVMKASATESTKTITNFNYTNDLYYSKEARYSYVTDKNH